MRLLWSLRPFPKGIAGQLTFLLIAALLLVHVVTFLIVAEEREDAVRATTLRFVVARTGAVHRLLKETPVDLHQSLLEAVRSPLIDFRTAPTATVSDRPDNRPERLLASLLERELELDQSQDIRIQAIARPWRVRASEEDRGAPSGRGRSRPALLLISLPLTLEESKAAHWLNVRVARPGVSTAWAWASLLSLILAAIGIALIVVLMTRRITRPLSRLAKAADLFGRGGDPQHVAPAGAVEIHQTIDAFNGMQERIARFVTDRTRMLAAMSHDLRTPITSLRLQAEFIEVPKLRDKIISILEQMEAIAESSLSFARQDAQSEAPRKTDLTALVDSIIEDACAQGLDVTGGGGAAIIAVVRTQAIRRALNNLVENACRYGERARLVLRQSKLGIEIDIDDDGPGMPEDQLEAVFEPFVRLEESRSCETGGVGLGLSIVRTIVQAHGGDVTLGNRTGGGLRATIWLPKGSHVSLRDHEGYPTSSV